MSDLSRFFVPSRKLAAYRLKNGGHRIYDPRERVGLELFDLLLRGASKVFPLRPTQEGQHAVDIERVLCLRLDRLGDLLTTLPALRALRRVASNARIELAVGSWNEPIAKRLPFVDAIRIVDTPWSSWEKRASLHKAYSALQSTSPDLAIDFQGDLRVILLMAMMRPVFRAGYGETGGSYLLTHRVRWDESKSWYWQNYEAVKTIYPDVQEDFQPFNFVNEEDRVRARALLDRDMDQQGRPIVGLHPSAGRRLKQWEASKFAALVDRLSNKMTVIVTGESVDRPLIESILTKVRSKPKVIMGVSLTTFAAEVEKFDVFVSGDTGPMHLSHAVGTPNVAIFGPSDPVRYGPSDPQTVRRVVRTPLYCSPCNMIRRPPRECAVKLTPDCITGVSFEQVLFAINDVLRKVET